MKTRSYKDLIVWQKSIELVMLIYKLTKNFPAEEKYGLISQLRRAAVAIASNIAEGYTRQHGPEFIQFLYVAFASAAEVETQLIISEKLGYGKKNSYIEIYSLHEEVSKMLNSMTRNLKSKYPSR